MKVKAIFRIPFPGQLAVALLATAIAVPAVGQTAAPQDQPQSAPAATSSSSQPMDHPPAAPASVQSTDAQEGFWGKVNPFARKKWVNKRVEPIKEQLGELDEVNAKNAKDIQGVDQRSQAGIRQAQSAADAANQTASAAGTEAGKANSTAQGAAGHVDQLNTTVNGLDQYKQATEANVVFRGGQPVLSAEAKKQLDDLASNLAGRQGYLVEIEGHSPQAGSLGIQSSQRLAEAVKRYLVTEHGIPVYRLHSVALGNAKPETSDDAKPVRVASSVHLRLMENSLAAQDSASPPGVASSTGADRP